MPSHFICEDPALRAVIGRLMRTMPTLSGDPVTIARARRLRDGRGAVHAGAFLRKRRIVFASSPSEFPRIFTHEVFHFVWVRLGNAARISYEELVRAEWLDGRSGELGWSSEWRKRALLRSDVRRRSRRWREYCCESFCDTAAWLYSGIAGHDEYRLPARACRYRRGWFEETLGSGAVPI